PAVHTPRRFQPVADDTVFTAINFIHQAFRRKVQLGQAGISQPEAYVVGEHFGDARQWLQADAEDAAMNYRGFTFPLWGFLA
ncbi:alpha-amylase family glycosyl hydrolase, partial [Citrobacter portucalensis]|uniref:alpha-amylase family glycosyl hydrolase n=1 Tax=Citrobacter portucalensis TaxID=1639133 RepID=UPI00397D5AFF